MDARPLSSRAIAVTGAIVFAFAVAVRMPSCYESFWLDELHSAWTVWEDLSDVTPRAVAGHQSPCYFLGLWIWKWLAGNSELAMRMSSVLATSSACAVLTWGVGRWAQSLLAGATAGMILALENNAIFFGTELRPYAFVILLSAVSTVCFLELWQSSSRFDRPRAWMLLVVSVLLATLLQPTAIGVLAMLPIALLGDWTRRDPSRNLRIAASDLVYMSLTVVTVISLWRITLADSWQQRSDWTAFGKATDVGQILAAWDWTWLWAIPNLLIVLSCCVATRRSFCGFDSQRALTIFVLSIIAAVSTSLYWLVSWWEWAPVWHRRYFIAVLPILATVCGGAIGLFPTSIDGRSARARAIVAACAAAFLVVGLGIRQGTVPALTHYPVALAKRGENWRDALRWIHDHAREQDRVLLDPDLIEMQFLDESGSSNHRDTTRMDDAATRATRVKDDYLIFAVRGPYGIERRVEPFLFDRNLVVERDGSSVPLRLREGERQLLIVRRPSYRLKKSRATNDAIYSFGAISIMIREASSETNGESSEVAGGLE